MRKKITMLLASLFACVGVMKAQVPVASTAPADGKWAADTKWYTIQGDASKFYVSINNVDGDGNLKLNNTASPAGAGLWCVVGDNEKGFQFYNFVAGASKVLGATGSEAAGRMKMYDVDAVSKDVVTSFDICALEGKTEYAFVKNHGSARDWWNNRGSYLAYWNSDYAYAANCTGSQYVFTEVTDFSAFIDVDAAKTAAKAELGNLAKITALFSDATQAQAEVDAVVATGTGLAELNAAVEAINAVVVAYKKQIDGKNVRFTTLGRNTTDGHDMTAVAAGGAGVTNSADAGIWTLMSNNDGTFKMYNFVSNLYLMGTRGQSQRVLTCGSFADAASYTFNVNDVNTVNLLNNGNTLHMDGSSNIVQWNDNNAGASIWKVESCAPIVVTREQYDPAAAAKESLPYAIQQAYGLVTDAANYYSNWKSDAEGSYEALLDNTSSYFHSAYTDEAKAETAPAHYIQANLESAVDEFYFYMAPRNANSRPVNITVSGSNDNEAFEEIKQISTTLASTSSYFSEKLGAAGKSYKHIRLTVTSTNTSTKFFTLSELYFLPAQSDVTNLVDSYNAFASSSITSETMAAAATALINAEGTLALSNIKKEIAALLSANESNHAATPKLGQYTTDAYDALNAAYVATDATQESLEAAIDAFKATKNLPVFTIDGVINYAAGKSVYDDQDGAPNFKATNVYDKTMWWVFDQTTETVGETESVNVINYATRKGFWGAEALKIGETDEKDANDGIYLFYTVGNGTPLHYQNANQVIVRWNSTAANSGSATRFTHIGNTYDLDKLTDAHVTALSALQTAYDAKVRYADVVIGDGIGQYQGDKDVIVAALETAKAITDKSLTEKAAMTVDAITTVTDAINNAEALVINQPKAGFYRIKSMNANDENKKGKNLLVSEGALALDKTESAASIMYIDAANGILNYGSGLYINTWNAPAEVGAQAVGWNFIENAQVAGTYALEYNDNTGGQMDYYLSDWKGDVTYGQNDANAAWIFEEVTELPVVVSAAGFATLYAPVALTIPAEGVTVYTATVEDGYLALTEVEDAIPANTGVIIEAAEGTYNFAVVAEAAAVESDLVGSFAKSVKNAEAKVYTLQAPKDKEVGFYLFKGQDAEGKTTYINGFRAWVEVAEGEEAPAMFTLGRGGEDEDATGIDQLISNGEVVIYDLSGRRVEKMEKGIYIVNGKKVVK